LGVIKVGTFSKKKKRFFSPKEAHLKKKEALLFKKEAKSTGGCQSRVKKVKILTCFFKTQNYSKFIPKTLKFLQLSI
jgi:hypothetical protein